MKSKGLLVLAFFALLFANYAWANNDTYYATVSATAKPTGAGTVYVNNTENSAQGQTGTQSGAIQFTLRAVANAGYEFRGWSTNNNLTVNANTNFDKGTSAEYTESFNASNTNNGNTSYNRYAYFSALPTFYFSATATPSPSSYGTASVAVATNATGEHWNSTSATTTATFTATPNPNYGFLGWSTSANGAIESTNNPYSLTITSTSTNSGSPTNTTRYARFAAIVNPTSISATDISVPMGSTITATNYTLTATSGNVPYIHVSATSGNTAIATVAQSGDGFTVTGVANGSATVTITAYNQDNTTPACSTTFTVTVIEPETGINGSIVTLNDYEDHNWSYYSDSLCPIRSLSPADVMITYYGDGIMMTGNDDYTASSNDYVDSDDEGYVGGAAVNRNGEDENTFIYYKTLERGDATQTSWTYSSGNQSSAASRCPYTTIPNPFQVRPTYGTPPTSNRATWTGWRGFQCWRLKSVSGGAVYSAASGGSALETGAVVNSETIIYFAPDSEYNMAVEFEAVWSIAYLVYANNNGSWSVPDHADKGYERNFVVLSSDKDFYFGVGNGNNTAYISNIDRPSTITPYLPNGTSGNNQTGRVQGQYSNNANNSNITLQANTKFENVQFSNMAQRTITAAGNNLIIGRGCTGTINNLNGATTNPSNDFKIRVESGTFNNAYVFNGASVSNTIAVETTFGSDYDRASNSGNGDNSKLTCGKFYMGYNAACTNSGSELNVYVLSGTFGSDAESNEFYMGFGNASGTSHSPRYLEVLGGNFRGGVAGGIEATTSGIATTTNVLTMRFKGGTVGRYLYSSGQHSPAFGSRKVIITGGTFNCFVTGGCYGTYADEGNTEGNGRIYFGGDAEQTVSSNGVFGAGYGQRNTAYSNGVYDSEGATVIVADMCEVAGSVYGGGNIGYANDDVDVHMLGGTVRGNVFGGANKAPSKGKVDVIMRGGTVEGDVYGGSNQSGDITGTVNVKVYGGTVNGGVYGCNNAGGAPQSTVNVDVYGTDPAPSAGSYAIYQVFGGGNHASYSGTPVVTVHCTDADMPISVGEIYGGGNNAEVAATNVTIEAGNIIGDVYGGGRQANVNGNTSVVVNGGTIGRVFGGNNTSGTIGGTISVEINKNGSCPMKIGQVFGGGNMADSQVGNVSIGCTGTLVSPLGDGERYGYDHEGIGAVYGGANNADIDGNISLTITSGIVDSVFGGNNAGGDIDGDITVTINKNSSASCASNWYVGYVFGGGNMAEYSQKTADHPVVNVQAGKVTHHVFGGGNGSGAKVTGNPKVTLSNTAQVGGNVFGGGNAAEVKGNTNVILKD